MRTNGLLTAVLFASITDLVSAAPADCAADNCLRALRATQTPGRVESARAFCSSFTAAATATATGTAAVPIPTYAQDACKENQNGDINFRISSACSCLPSAATTTTTIPTPSNEPCAKVSSVWAAQIKTNPRPTVAASLAHECLKTVPLGENEAIELVDALKPYLEWQSDAGYKKDPPKDYFYPAVDIFGNLNKVRAKIVAGEYAGEYDFQIDLYKTVFAAGHDGHFVVYTDLLAKVMTWTRPRGLVSISEDGQSLPVIKLYEDVMSSPETASVVKTINGVDAAKFVEDEINVATYNQDVDSAYNSMFYQASIKPTSNRGYFYAGGRLSQLYHGPNTTFVFENGTVATMENMAAIAGSFDGVVDGASLYNKFCAITPGTNRSNAPDPPPAAIPQLSGYPQPVIATKDNVVSGYYLSGPGLEDVAVIALRAFSSNSSTEFQAVIRDFFAEAVHAGKKKLVIDFQGNGGGLILLGYDLFRQLFPNVQEDGFSRWKGNPAFIHIAKAFSNSVDGFDPFNSPDNEKIYDYKTWFNYRYDLNLTRQDFSTFQDKFAPHVYKNTPYTNIMRWNLSNPLTTVNSTFGAGIEIAGYGKLQNLTQPFEAHNIVMLYDGVCASTCSLASEMLRIQGAVRSVAFGGRPKEGPIQGVGGVKGAQVLKFSNILRYVERAATLTNDSKALAEFARYTELPLLRSTAASVNVRDQISRNNIDDGVPAQFVTENADCRLYWTQPMLTDISEVWKAAANSAFNAKKCAYGGIKISTPGPAGPGAASTLAAAGDDEVVAQPGGPKPQRTSETIDLSVGPSVDDEMWQAVYLQQAIE